MGKIRGKWIHSGDKADTRLHFQIIYHQSTVEDPMPGKPYQSCLIPYQVEIIALRSQKPPVSYARIAELLRKKHGLNIQRAAIGKFVKVRAKGRKVYFFKRDKEGKKTTPPPAAASKAEPQQLKPEWDFKYSERYNLTRLPPEVAAARRKKLEEEGH
jgi:hypothetical protein